MSSDLQTQFVHIWTVIIIIIMLLAGRYIQFSSNTTRVACVVTSDWSTNGDTVVERVVLGQKGCMLLGSGWIRSPPVITVAVIRQTDRNTSLQCLRFIEFTIDCVRVGGPSSGSKWKSLLKFALEFLLWIKKYKTTYFIQKLYVQVLFLSSTKETVFKYIYDVIVLS